MNLKELKYGHRNEINIRRASLLLFTFYVHLKWEIIISSSFKTDETINALHYTDAQEILIFWASEPIPIFSLKAWASNRMWINGKESISVQLGFGHFPVIAVYRLHFCRGTSSASTSVNMRTLFQKCPEELLLTCYFKSGNLCWNRSLCRLYCYCADIDTTLVLCQCSGSGTAFCWT